MLKFTEAHEWLKIEGDVATVGITEFAATELGDLVFIELPEIGSKIEANAEVATVESVKAASEVYAPLNGEIIEVNQTLEDEPGLVNEDAQGKGWLFKMKLNAVSDADALMDEAAYASLIG